MSGWVAGAMVVGSIYTAGQTRGAARDVAASQVSAAETAAASQERIAAEAQALNVERYGEARELMDPYISEARTAREQQMIEMGLAPGEAGTAYMETPGYEKLLEERQRGAEQAAAGAGSLYSGRRIQSAADVGGATQSQFYQNYMGMLQNLGSPSAATNLASLGVGQAATMGQQQLAAGQAASGFRVGGAQAAGQATMAGAGAQQAMMGDVMGGAANIYSGYLSRPTTPPGPGTSGWGDWLGV